MSIFCTNDVMCHAFPITSQYLERWGIDSPATVPSARPLDLGSKLYPSNMQCMLNKDLPRFLLEYNKFEQAKGRLWLQCAHGTNTYKTYSNTLFQNHHKRYHSCHKFVFMLIAPQQLVFKLKFLRIMQM